MLKNIHCLSQIQMQLGIFLSLEKVESGDLISRSRNPREETYLWAGEGQHIFRQSSPLHWRLV